MHTDELEPNTQTAIVSAANRTATPHDYRATDWKRANRRVKNLRQRIFKAARNGDTAQVRNLQKLMLRSSSNTVLSVRRVAQENAGKKTAGVDGRVALTLEARGKLVDELQSHQPWRVQPTRRVYIPKSNGKRRPLGIPTILDRAHQARVKNALEPEWEAYFEPSSHGFRPGRRTHDAVRSAMLFARPRAKKVWVLDADIAGAFDNIGHASILDAIARFPARELVKQWLKAGYMENAVKRETPSGTPQGGVISPLLANIALHGMEDALGVRRDVSTGAVDRSRFALVRYADDFLVFCHSEEDAWSAKEILTGWLGQRGLSFSEEKTRVVHVQSGYDFLGFHIRQYVRYDNTGNYIGLVKPSKDSMKSIREKIRDIVRRHYGSNAQALIKALNPLIRGWANYHRWFNASYNFQQLDYYLHNLLWRWARRMHHGKSKYWTKEQYFGQWNKQRQDHWVFGDRVTGTYVAKFAWFSIKPYVQVKGRSSPDDQRLNRYWAERSAKFSNLSPGVYKIAAAQGHKCPICGESLHNGEPVERHHMIMNRENPERKMLQNQRMLHTFCHQQTHGSRKSQLPKSTQEMILDA